jgi:hypothetical protein
MNINELFEDLQDNVLDDLNGELILEKNCIIWSYDIDRDGAMVENESNDDIDEFEYCFSSVNSSEEILQQAYNEDLSIIETYIAELDDNANWSFSDPKIGESVISFKIT